MKKRMMSKRLYIMYKVRVRTMRLVLLALLTTCCMACSGSGGDDSTDPVVPPTPTPTEQGKPISFSSGLQEEQEVSTGGSSGNSITRSTGLETVLTDRSFKVWGYKNDAYNSNTGYTSYQTVFPGFIVNWVESSAHTTTSNTHDWEYVGQAADQTIKYWDFGAKAYRFFGVAPSGNYTPGVSGDNVTLTFTADATTESTATATPYYSHLWFKENSTLANMAGNPVTLEFLKPFSQVTVKFIDESGSPYIEESIKSFSFKPTDENKKVSVKGVVTISYPLKGLTTEESVSVTPASEGYLESGISGAEKNTLSQTVLPASNQGTYTMTLKLITDAENANHTSVVPPGYLNWKPGYVYTYIFKIFKDDTVVLDVVQVGIRDWGIGNEVDHDLYNW